jgi:peroxiredoxin Q/BCP
MKLRTRWSLGAGLVALCFGCERGSSSPASTTESSVASSAAPVVGDHAPNVSLTTEKGTTLDLHSLRGKRVVLYFYPEDRTKGCTIEARGIRDSFTSFERAGLVVFGVSTQDAASHQAFVAEESLPFDLVVDTSGEVARAFGVTISGGRAARDTVLIDEQGLIRQIWRGVSPADHAERILAEVAKW